MPARTRRPGPQPFLCELCNPPLSSVGPDPERVGYEAAELLDALMAEKSQSQRRITIQPARVFARQSTEVMAISDWAVASATRYMREQALHGCKVSDVLRR
jgi:LacI family transcriptional regulator